MAWHRNQKNKTFFVRFKKLGYQLSLGEGRNEHSNELI